MGVPSIPADVYLSVSRDSLALGAYGPVEALQPLDLMPRTAVLAMFVLFAVAWCYALKTAAHHHDLAVIAAALAEDLE